MSGRITLIEAWQTRDGHLVSLNDQLLAIEDLQQFVATMTWLGHPTSLARMVYDPIHAREQMAIAREIEDVRLQTVTTRLMGAYESAPDDAA